jgi:hypothetical protein
MLGWVCYTEYLRIIKKNISFAAISQLRVKYCNSPIGIEMF